MAEDLSYWQKRYLKIKADAIAAAELEMGAQSESWWL